MTFFDRLLRLFRPGKTFKTPKGWTTTKIDDTTYSHTISPELKQKWINERRERDNLQSFINIDGFHEKNNGRAGTIYYVESGRILEINYEISGVPQYDLLIYFDAVDEWALPVKKSISFAEKETIKERLKAWFDERKIRAEL
jgi:hypothetical protein